MRTKAMKRVTLYSLSLYAPQLVGEEILNLFCHIEVSSSSRHIWQWVSSHLPWNRDSLLRICIVENYTLILVHMMSRVEKKLVLVSNSTKMKISKSYERRSVVKSP